FNALLKTLEEPPEKVKFFFATTEPHKVLPTIISRCQRFDLARIQPALIASKLHQIGGDLNRIVEPEALHLIASFADGSLRDAESLLDQILCFAEGTITSSLVRQSLGLVPEEHFFALDRAFGAYDLAFAFELTDELFQTGKDLAHFLEQLIEHYRTLTVCKTRVEKIAPEILSRYLPSSRLYTQAQCLYILDLLIHAEAQFHKSSFQRISLESILLQIIRSKNRIPVEVLVRRLSELEDHLNQQNIGIPVAMPVEIEKSTAPIAPEPLILQNSEPEPALPVSPELKPIPFTPRKAPESVEVPVEVEKSTAPIAPELSASQNS
ncbi:MAG: DNA polymerase III subunit gamma/tau, partial [Chlamydiota bacterium]